MKMDFGLFSGSRLKWGGAEGIGRVGDGGLGVSICPLDGVGLGDRSKYRAFLFSSLAISTSETPIIN